MTTPPRLLRDCEASIFPRDDSDLVQCHRWDPTTIPAIDTALVLGRPLLVRGESGIGKSQLARAAAVNLGRAFVDFTVDERTESRDLLYEIDHVHRLGQAQIAARVEGIDLDVLKYTRPGPLWWGINWTSASHCAGARPWAPKDWQLTDGVVVLIDEIDKGDSAVPNGLLNALGDLAFDAPDGKRVARDPAMPPPLVVVTTNRERRLPDAFVRRCLVLDMKLPTEETELTARLIEVASASATKVDAGVVKDAVERCIKARTRDQRDGLRGPSLAELIDLVVALSKENTKKAQKDRLDAIQGFFFDKHVGAAP